MKKFITSLSLAVILLTILNGCNKKDAFSSDALADYMQLSVGKYIRYRLDSMLFINFGQKDTTIKYQAKDVIDAAITDNLGRPSWRVVRYLRDTAGILPWTSTGTYMITPTFETIEVIENNLRYQKLKLPIKEGFNWKGNTFIDTYSINSEVRYLDDWDYVYEALGSNFPVFGNTVIPNTITVNQRDEIIGLPSDPNAYSEKNYSIEVYAKGVGMIYRDFLHWEYQPPNGGNPGYKNGYGIKLLMIDHN